MTVYRTCYGCCLRGKPCDRRDTVAKAIKGLAVSSLKFQCFSRTPVYAVGTPVWLKTVYDMDGDSDENGIPVDYYPGHVVQDLGSRALVFVKPGSLGRDDGDLAFVSKNNGFCRVSLKKLSRREGPVEAVCPDCTLPASAGHLEGSTCSMVREVAA